MKSMKKLQVAVAVTALFAATGSMAASISQSGVTIAREVITKAVSTQKLRAPSLSFNFDNGPSANANSSQDFNITLALGGDGTPTWDASQLPTFKSISANRRNNGGTTVDIKPNVAGGPLATDGVNAGASGIEFMGAAVFTETDGKPAIRYRFRLVNNTAASINLGDLQIAFNTVNPGSAPADTDYALVTTLDKSVNAIVGSKVGANGLGSGCGNEDTRVNVVARNYIGSGDGVIGESGTVGALNNGYILFAQALNVEMGNEWATGKALPNRSTDPTASNFKLTADTSGFGTVNVMPLGYIKFTNRENLDAWDTSIKDGYYKFRKDGAATLDGELPATAPLNIDGDIDLPDTGTALSIKITSTSGFASGATFSIANNPYCLVGAAGAAGVNSGAAGAVTGLDTNVATVTFTAANLSAAANAVPDATLLGSTGALGAAPGYVASTDRFYLCYTVPGTTQVPTSAFSAVATLLKQATSDEQSNISCPADLANLGGGVKIDVRNFFPYTSDEQEWMSVLRVINNSETVDADLTFQYIRADGKYGKWGSTASKLPARGALYFTSREIHNLLVNDTATSLPKDNTGAGGLTGTALNSVAPNTRVRVSSNAASTLRVQNYMFNKNTLQLVEVSASQGADFENLGSSGRDHIDQDAQVGIKK